ncbi:hypothetical protein [Exiguobacterium artemiae]|uniref:hypothetical protein n=1 Tax=Exiguobacterium artemiae TaxID=340145 RepID=UPI002963DE56|nr:hypothetical protein [Exiguobacterium sibiricum]MDW2885883.1 hypothetical protein [Exiguobacterium sibiricum]
MTIRELTEPMKTMLEWMNRYYHAQKNELLENTKNAYSKALFYAPTKLSRGRIAS